jgi:hypothetical protein
LATGKAYFQVRTELGAKPCRYVLPTWAVVDPRSLLISTPHGAHVGVSYSDLGAGARSNADTIRQLEENSAGFERRFYVGDSVGLDTGFYGAPARQGTSDQVASLILWRLHGVVIVAIVWPGSSRAAREEGYEVARFVFFSLEPGGRTAH